MRRLFGVIVLSAVGMCTLEICGTNSGLLMPRAAADEPSKLHPLEPLTRLGRVLGFGWGDGYHACERNVHSPLSNLPPHSYATRPAGRPHAAAAHRQQGVYHAPATQPRPRPSVLQFPVPAAVLEELNSLKNDPQQVPPPKGSAQRLPATTVPAGPDLRDPVSIREDLHAMLDSLQTEPPASQTSDSETSTDASPSDRQDPQPLDQPLEEREETLEDDEDLLLDDQAAVRHFIREPLPGTPSRMPASERIADEDTQSLRK